MNDPGTEDGGARARLREMLRERAVLHGDFLLSSGSRSPYYLDARLVTLSSAGSLLVAETFLATLPGGLDGVAGPSIGADPIVTAIALVSGVRRQPLDAFIVRGEQKGHGAGRRIEGPWRQGLRVAVVDDTLTTGRSCLEAASVVEEEGATVAGIYALIDRGQGAREAIEAAGYTYAPIFSAGELLHTT